MCAHEQICVYRAMVCLLGDLINHRAGDGIGLIIKRAGIFIYSSSRRSVEINASTTLDRKHRVR